MNCHLCTNKLYVWKTPNLNVGWTQYSEEYLYDCRTHSCKLPNLVQRCRLKYSPAISKQYFSSAEFWIPEEKFWYQLLIESNKSIAINKISVYHYGDRHGVTKISGSEPKEFFKLEQDFSVSLKDNLPEKVPRLLKRIKNLIVFT
jgi:hypothetical protein